MCPIDTSVIVNGGITVYEKNTVLTMYQHFPSIKILLVYSKVNKNIRKNKEIILAYWPGLKSIVDSINNLSWKSIDVFEQIKDIKGVNTSELDTIPESYYDELVELIHMNQGLLKMLNVPHGNVDIICAIAQEHFLYGKMTDSRGKLAGKDSEFMFHLLLLNVENEDISGIMEEFKKHSFSTMVTDS
ncbi:mevalonate kinase-like [Pogonomyrmex barbatus]|uniref:Mevalonate kinase-like n=1 Tax=Pogonomyrmex barbatus TaxID=144034 RepID=A0A6I9WLZ6_9HYME|nr:mevalonate kinase-like [Pogonomyrmex barbatus]